MKGRKRILSAVLLLILLGVATWRMVTPRPSPYQAPLNRLIASRGTSAEALAAFRTSGPEVVPFLIHKLTNSEASRGKYVSFKSAIRFSRLYRILPSWSFNAWSEREYAAA